MTVTLFNNTNRMKVIPLPHATYCAALGKCVCMTIPGMKTKVASSLTIPAGEAATGIPEAVLRVPLVDRMVRKGELAVNQAPVKAQPALKLRPPKKPSRKKKRSAS